MKLKNILLVVKDIELSKVFYRDLFGLDVIRDFGENVMLTEGLVLQEQKSWEELTGCETEFGTHNAELYFEERNMDAFLEKLEKYSNPIEYLNECAMQEGGKRVLRIYDPDGHVIEVGEAAAGERVLRVNREEYRIEKLLGKGKGGYSYLVSDGAKRYVLKQIHHEPCSYYQFGNKIEAEMNDYNRLKEIGIRIPQMLAVDRERERILKEYIDGDTIYDLVLRDGVKDSYLEQVQEMCQRLYAAKTNIDYFPTNFVVQEDEIFYIDFECNDYMEEWNFENWGVKYWSKTPEFLKYLEEHK